MFNLIRFPSISRNPRISLHSPNFITLSHPTFSNKMHFIVTNSLSLSLSTWYPDQTFPRWFRKGKQTNGEVKTTRASRGARVGGKERKGGRGGEKEDMEVLQIKYGTGGENGATRSYVPVAVEGGKGCELLHARRRRTIALSGARILYTRGTCARHACELYLRYICKYVRQCVSVEC